MADFMFPPWIHAPESVAKSYATGLELGSSIQNQRAALQEKEASDALWASISQQRNAQDQQYRQAQLAQEQQRLQQDEQLNQLKVQDAQRKFAAQQQYQQFISGGGDPLEGIMKFFPGTDESMTGYGQLARQMQLSKLGGAQPEVVTMGGQQFLKHRNEQGGWSYTHIPQAQDTLGRFLKEEGVRELYKDAAAAQKSLLENFPNIQALLVKPASELTPGETNTLKRYNQARAEVEHADWARRKREYELAPQDFPPPGDDPTAPSPPGARSAPPIGRPRTASVSEETSAAVSAPSSMGMVGTARSVITDAWKAAQEFLRLHDPTNYSPNTNAPPGSPGARQSDIDLYNYMMEGLQQ